jgi:adsorption protein B
LALLILLSGLDDLLIDLCWVWRAVRGLTGRRAAPPRHDPSSLPLLAVFLPLWREDAVIERMLDHNLPSLDYPSFVVFAGAYPNDMATLAALRRAAARHPNLVIARVPHAGPTSKADCLNAIYREMCDWEARTGQRADAVVLHDAEDLIHPASFRDIAQALSEADMAQMPVLPLPTPWRDFTHGVYCDDFAESQTKDLETRVELGAFLPGCGVGTAMRRSALESLASRNGGLPFRPECLTEDYDLGLRLHELGCSQTMLPVRFAGESPVATREYFPRGWRAAVRQRSRWVTGNALQAWETHGWPRGWVQRWFLLHDRKGLLCNPLSTVCNLLVMLLACGVLDARGFALPRWLLAMNSLILVERIAMRTAACASIYGLPYALLAPLRMLWGNTINTVATARAIWTWTHARLLRRTLSWAKTDHAYPVIAHRPHLVRITSIASRAIAPRLARSLPRELLRQAAVLPYLVADGVLHIAGPEKPSDHLLARAHRLSGMPVRFSLIAPSEYERLSARLL